MTKMAININQESVTHNNLSLNPRGRKALDLKDKCTKPVSFRLNEEQHAKLEEYSKSRGGYAAVIKALLADKGII